MRGEERTHLSMVRSLGRSQTVVAVRSMRRFSAGSVMGTAVGGRSAAADSFRWKVNRGSPGGWRTSHGGRACR